MFKGAYSTKSGYLAGYPAQPINKFSSGLVYLVSAVSSPVFGGLIDKTGRNINWVLWAVAGMMGIFIIVT